MSRAEPLIPKAPRQSVQSLCLIVIAVATLTYMVFWLRPVLVPFVVALFVVSGITPVLEFVEKYLGVNRLISSVIAFVLGLLLLVALSFCIWGSVQQLAVQSKAYRARVAELLGIAHAWFPTEPLGLEEIQHELEDSLIDPQDRIVEQEGAGVAQGATGSDPNDEGESGTDDNGQTSQLAAGASLPEDDVQEIATHEVSSIKKFVDRSIREGVTHVTSALLEVLSTSVVVLIYVFFLILGSPDSTRMSGSMQAIDHQVRSYLFLKTMISAATGIAFGGALWILGVPMSLTFGLLAFLLNFIPNVGPVVASLLPIPFILLSPDGSVWWMICAIAITMSIQVVSGSVIEPKMMGETSDLHPVVILLALMFWGMMWGITGMFLATPITAGIKIVLEGNPTTKPAADILAGRWQREEADPEPAPVS
ncbi:MAG: AI-2E family transporter [Planctomycetota bacterium]